jgi:C1A family cysteine protease
MRVGGWIPDPEDPRDARFDWRKRPQMSVPLCKEVNLWLPGMRIRSQAHNDCTGQAGAYAMRIALCASLGRDVGELSPLFLYYTGRAVWGGQNVDDGSYLRTLFSAIQVQGSCAESIFPYDQTRVDESPKWKQVKNAFRHRGLRKYRNISDPDHAREALSEGIPLVGGWDVDQAFLDWSGGAPVGAPRGSLGGHAMAVVGYSDKGFLLANSWGSWRGEGGFWRASEEFLMSTNRLYACDTSEVS